MPHRTRCWTPLAVILAAAGCSQLAVKQQPLMSDQRLPAAPTGSSLVFGEVDPPDDDWIATRNDKGLGVRQQQSVYYGPGGRLYYPDGTPVEFKGVRKQLQDLRAEERIR